MRYPRFFKTRRSKYPSFPRKRESSKGAKYWISSLRGNDGVGNASGYPIILPNDCVKFKMTSY
jgi:hypothetical protein